MLSLQFMKAVYMDNVEYCLGRALNVFCQIFSTSRGGRVHRTREVHICCTKVVRQRQNVHKLHKVLSISLGGLMECAIFDV